ncbi:MAG: DUF917 domain-containing protein [Colwellia sp.]|nr:DUF917 domain-containing protein [Colwellia sp.]
MTRKLGKMELNDIANGASLLASGGGGSVTLSKQMIKEILYTTDYVELATEKEVPNDTIGVVVGGIGSPNALKRIGLHDASLRALASFLQTQDKKLGFTLAIETGPNIFISMLAAVKNIPPVPIVDGDGAGRSVPTLGTLTYAQTISTTPFTVSNTQSQLTTEQASINVCVNVDSSDLPETASIVENMIRPIISGAGEFDNIAGFAGWSLSAQELIEKKPIITGTITRAQEIGEALRKGADNPLASLRKVLGDDLFSLALGDTLVELVSDPADSESTSDGFDRGVMVFKNNSSEIHVINQNENLIAWDNKRDRPLAMAPDLICYLTPEGDSLSNADLKKGDKIYLLGIKADDRLRKSPILDAFLDVLKTVGYYGPYQTIENLQG